jgi:hypothetical protein
MAKKMLAVLAVVFLFFSFFALNTEAASKATVTITVVDEAGNPVADADVRFYLVGSGLFKQTDSSGQIVFKVKKNSKKYRVEIYKGLDIAPYKAKIKVNKNKVTFTATVKPRGYGDLRVIVKDSTGNPIVGKSIMVGGQTVETDENGCALFIDLLESRYMIKIIIPGYKTGSSYADVVKDKEKSITIKMKEK